MPRVKPVDALSILRKNMANINRVGRFCYVLFSTGIPTSPSKKLFLRYEKSDFTCSSLKIMDDVSVSFRNSPVRVVVPKSLKKCMKTAREHFPLFIEVAINRILFLERTRVINQSH